MLSSPDYRSGPHLDLDLDLCPKSGVCLIERSIHKNRQAMVGILSKHTHMLYNARQNANKTARNHNHHLTHPSTSLNHTPESHRRFQRPNRSIHTVWLRTSMETRFLESGITTIPILIIIIILVRAAAMVVIWRRGSSTSRLCGCVRTGQIRVRIADGNRQLITGSGEMA